MSIEQPVEQPVEQPKVSIILMVHNGRTQLFKRVVQSVMSQTYKNWELVIQDDCSTDGTLEMAIGFSLRDKRIRLFSNKTNLGIVKNRAAAFRNTTGALICHLDSDDFIYEFALEVMVSAFRASPHVGLAYSDMAYVDEAGEPSSYMVNKGPVDDDFYGRGWRHFGMYKRSAYDQTNGYNEELVNPCEDGDLLAQIAEKVPVMRVPRVLYAYRNAGDHESSKKEPCHECASRTKCNFIRIWASKLNPPLDVVTWKHIKAQEAPTLTNVKV